MSKNGCRNFIYLDKLGKPCDRDIHLKGFLDQVKDLGIVFAPEQKISGCENIKELEEKLEEAKKKNENAKAGSLADKANLVKRFNEGQK